MKGGGLVAALALFSLLTPVAAFARGVRLSHQHHRLPGVAQRPPSPLLPRTAIVPHREERIVSMSSAGSGVALTRLKSRLWSVGWLSWWAQIILSTVSGVLLLFANSVSQSLSAATIAGRLLALVGLAASFVSAFWSWGYTRLSTKLDKRSTPVGEAAVKATSTLRMGLAINLFGMGMSILGAEAIVGTLAAKTLTQGSALVATASGASGFVQALDVLIVQANTNTIAAHFFGLCAVMRIQGAADVAAISASTKSV
ncbi:hypothetical protein AB1Y20_001019 [Prymnesium parvum]|uniref:Uncharacterized protein n=1 Tax=Prymnesium parvum TaxID=97485 RepID=A0AB34K9U9_PRYPA